MAKFDASENEVKELVFEGYPTLILYSRENKQGIKFKGAHTLKHIEAWLAQYNSGHEFV